MERRKYLSYWTGMFFFYLNKIVGSDWALVRLHRSAITLHKDMNKDKK